MPLMPVPSQDIKGTGLVRSLLETLTWFESQHATETILLRDMLRNYISVHIRQGTGTGSLNGRQCFRVPAGLDTKATVSLVSEGWGVRPDGIPAMSMAAEREIILPLIVTLNNAFGMKLSNAICFDRSDKALRDAKL